MYEEMLKYLGLFSLGKNPLKEVCKIMQRMGVELFCPIPEH